MDEVWLYDRNGIHHGVLGKLRLIRELRQRQFDAALLFQNAFEAAILTGLAGIPIRAGYDRDFRGWLLTHKVSIDPGVRKELREGERRQWYFSCTLHIPDVKHKVRVVIL